MKILQGLVLAVVGNIPVQIGIFTGLGFLSQLYESAHKGSLVCGFYTFSPCTFLELLSSSAPVGLMLAFVFNISYLFAPTILISLVLFMLGSMPPRQR